MKRILAAALILSFSVSGLLITGCTYTPIEPENSEFTEQESSGKPRSEIPKEKPVRVPMTAE